VYLATLTKAYKIDKYEKNEEKILPRGLSRNKNFLSVRL